MSTQAERRANGLDVMATLAGSEDAGDGADQMELWAARAAFAKIDARG